MTKGILFLDVDGVLNSAAWFMAAKENYRRLEPALVTLVNQITDRTGAEIVISSSWRFMFKTIDEARDFFRAEGITGTVIDMTPKSGLTPKDACRGGEINLWRRQHPDSTGRPFVILDDDSDMEPLMEHLVQTKTNTGIAPRDAEQAVRLLTGSPKDVT